MYSSPDLGKVTFIALPHITGQQRQVFIRVESVVTRDLIDMFKSYLPVFKNDIEKITTIDRPDADFVITMTENVTTDEAANKIAETLVERVRTYIAKQHRQVESLKAGHGCAVHSEVRAFHGSGD